MAKTLNAKSAGAKEKADALDSRVDNSH